MAAEFDVYCATSALQFHEHAVVTLDGIDGFFDQYFEAVLPGQIIRFAGPQDGNLAEAQPRFWPPLWTGTITGP